ELLSVWRWRISSRRCFLYRSATSLNFFLCISSVVPFFSRRVGLLRWWVFARVISCYNCSRRDTVYSISFPSIMIDSTRAIPGPNQSLQPTAGPAYSFTFRVLTQVHSKLHLPPPAVTYL